MASENQRPINTVSAPFRTVAGEQNLDPEVASAIPNLGIGTNDIY